MEGWSVGRASGSIGPSRSSALGILRRSGATLALSLLLSLVAGACGSTAPSPSQALPSSVSSPVSTPVPSSSGTAGVAIDPSLLRILPSSIDGRSLDEATEAERSAVADPALERWADRLAVAYVASPSKEDWAIASVVGLRPGPFGDADFRSWRDTYESGACAPVGGPGGHAQAAIGGRTVYIGTCGALRIYQVLLAQPGRVVAVTSAGAADFGERLIAGLRP